MPMWQWNDAHSAMLAKAAFNIFFGCNVGVVEERDNTTMKRPAYGFGSGSNTIGLNPRTLRINPIFPLMSTMIHHITKVVKTKLPEWVPVLNETPFNFCDMKAYYGIWNDVTRTYQQKKACGWHRDVTYSKNGVPHKNNSQIAGTPVAILVFGSEKNLWFRRHCGKVHYHNSIIHFRQTSGSLFILDPRDEQTNSHGEFWKHMSNMAQPDGISFSFTFRCVKNTINVTPVGYLASPEEHTCPDKDAKYRAAEHKVTGETYTRTIGEIEKRVADFLDNFQT